ncbi:MAG TPA: hypothetical protein DCR55_12005 [Lentisphaeria bacterium]|nr:hypothetical protein [Lentisphaeria bacterium]
MKIIEQMLSAAQYNRGMDIVIISTTSAMQEVYWQQRLEASKGQIANRSGLILAVHEDWPGGAGNGLGTLYCLQKAVERAKSTGVDLLQRLRDGASLAIYHTAGKGTRLAPLPAAENNNKPAVKLPGMLHIDGAQRPITILESVIRQTSVYAPARAGYVSVFWGDQIFIPTTDPARQPRAHVEILCQLSSFPSEQEWQTRGLQNYGLIAVDAAGNARQAEKISYGQAKKLLVDGVINADGGIGPSIGSFTMSALMTEALLAEFATELAQKQGKMDTDPHFWMPMALPLATYAEVMQAKGAKEPAAHHARIRRMLETLPAQQAVLGAMDVGADSYWWDYGQLTGYHGNCMRLLRDDEEGRAMRQFFAAPEPDENGAICIGCTIGRGRAFDSLLIDVACESVAVARAAVVGLRAPSLEGQGIIVYQHLSRTAVTVEDGGVIADSVLPPDERVSMHTQIGRHGGDDWHEVLAGNPVSYDTLHKRNHAIDPLAAEQLAIAQFASYQTGPSDG